VSEAVLHKSGQARLKGQTPTLPDAVSEETLHKSSQARLKGLITPTLPDAVSDKLKGLTPTPADR